MERFKDIATRLLIAFALISLGFSLGKHSALKTMETKIPSASATAPVSPEIPAGVGKGDSTPVAETVKVYYFHSSFRCSTCTTMEKFVDELMEKRYSSEISQGRINYARADFQTQDTLAAQFQVAAGCVVVARFAQDRLISFQRLEEVWTKVEDRADFDSYVAAAIDSALGGKP